MRKKYASDITRQKFEEIRFLHAKRAQADQANDGGYS